MQVVHAALLLRRGRAQLEAQAPLVEVLAQVLLRSEEGLQGIARLSF